MTDSVIELRDLNLELESLKARKDAIKKQLAEHRDTLTDEQIATSTTEATEVRDAIKSVEEKIKLAQEKVSAENEKNENRSIEKMENLEKRSTMEYRKAFMDYIQRGVASEILETRADAYTSTSTASTVIPNTVLDEIIKASKISGNILAKVRKMNVKGGVRVPTLSVIPTATWITEDKSSDRQGLSTGSVQFSYYGLEVKIAQSLLSEYTSIDAFEREFASLAVEAMTNAKEVAIFNGSGVGQPTGILKDAGVKEVALTLAELGKYDKLVGACGNLAVGYRAGAEFAMASSTWDKIVGMVDSQGQPVARVNYGLNGATMSLFGYPVNLVEADRIKGVDTATAGTDYVIVLGQFNKYGLNSNGEIGVIKYVDHDHNQTVTKALEFVDGKVLDTNAFIKIKLKTGTST
jgi:HK97 family phage major capsid protein